LKQRIAADPSAVLGEDGLSLHKVEFPFITGDRIDVVLRDKDKKFVAVEVEVECDRNHLAGALQCMKYRAMLAYYFERPLEEVRCILVAHKIASEVNARCAAFEIETIMVARPIRPSTVGSPLLIGSVAATC
jgi:RecB family endonuclease NucS